MHIDVTIEKQRDMRSVLGTNFVPRRLTTIITSVLALSLWCLRRKWSITRTSRTVRTEYSSYQLISRRRQYGVHRHSPVRILRPEQLLVFRFCVALAVLLSKPVPCPHDANDLVCIYSPTQVPRLQTPASGLCPQRWMVVWR